MNAYLTILQKILMQVNQNPSNIIFKSNNSINLLSNTCLGYHLWDMASRFFLLYTSSILYQWVLNPVQAGALEYVSAVYPLILIVVTYNFVEFHDNENRLVTFLWIPFKRLSKHKSFKDWNIKYSLISSFATFLQLAYSKILYIFIVLMNYTNVKIIRVLHKDASVMYISNIHIPTLFLLSSC